MTQFDESSDPFADLNRKRREMERAWDLRQENIVPLETAWNEGRFCGLILKGRSSLTRLQRVGTLVVGLHLIGTVIMVFFIDWPFPITDPSLRSLSGRLPNISLLWVPQLLLYLGLGVRFCWVALTLFRPPD